MSITRSSNILPIVKLIPNASFAGLSLSSFQPLILKRNKTKVKIVQLGKTLSFVKFDVEWGGAEGGKRGGKTLDCSSLTLKRPTYQILASCYA